MPIRICKRYLHLDEDAYVFLGRPPGVSFIYSGWNLFITFFPQRAGFRKFIKTDGAWKIDVQTEKYLRPGLYAVERNTDFLYPCLVVRDCLNIFMVDVMKAKPGVSDSHRN